MAVLHILATWLPLLLAAGTVLWLGWRGKPAWATPRCGACGYDLRGRDPEQVADCPECGADLQKKRAVRFARRGGHRWGVMWWGVWLAAMPFVVTGGFWLQSLSQARLNPAARISPGQLQQLTTDDLIRHQLPQQFDEPWVWNVLDQRLGRGEMTGGQVAEAVRVLTQQMAAAKPLGWDGPLSWSGTFMKQALAIPGVPDAEKVAFYQAYHGNTPQIGPLQRLPDGEQQVEVRVEFGNTWGSSMPHVLAWRIRDIQVAGGSASFTTQQIGGNMFEADAKARLEPGPHEVVVELECILYDVGRYPNVDLSAVPAANWPAGMHRWTIEAKTSLEVMDPAVPAVRQVEAIEMRAAIEAGVKIPAVTLARRGSSDTLASFEVDVELDLPVPVSFDVSLDFGNGQEPQNVGIAYWWLQGDEVRDWVSNLGSLTHPPSPDVREVTVILTPNPEHVEEYAEVTEIWGGTMRIEGVPLQRLDLPADER